MVLCLSYDAISSLRILKVSLIGFSAGGINHQENMRSISLWLHYILVLSVVATAIHQKKVVLRLHEVEFMPLMIGTPSI